MVSTNFDNIRPSENPYNHDTSLLPVTSVTYLTKNLNGRYRGSKRKASDLNIPGYEYPLLSNQFGLSLVRTSSPENMEMIYRESSSLAPGALPSIKAGITVLDSIHNHVHHNNQESKPVGVESSPHHHSSTQLSNGTPNVTKKGAPKKNSTRSLTAQGIVRAREVRKGGGACEGCKYNKKLVSGTPTALGRDLHHN
jgi:hypothetical protein